MVNKTNEALTKMTAENGREHNADRYPTPEKRKARVALSQRLLDEVVVPAIQRGHISDVEGLRCLIAKFRGDNAGLGDDFDIGHTWLLAREQHIVNWCLADKAPEQLPTNAADVAVAVSLLEQIAFPPKT